MSSKRIIDARIEVANVRGRPSRTRANAREYARMRAKVIRGPRLIGCCYEMILFSGSDHASASRWPMFRGSLVPRYRRIYGEYNARAVRKNT